MAHHIMFQLWGVHPTNAWKKYLMGKATVDFILVFTNARFSTAISQSYVYINQSLCAHLTVNISLPFKDSPLACDGHQWFPWLLLNEHFPGLGLARALKSNIGL